jgi:AbrB family looped-hinge helix DNA binding protein
MMITSKGQVTIPKEIRDMCGLQPHTEVEISLIEGKVVIHPAGQPEDRGNAIIEHFRRHAKQALQTELTTDEIMVLTRGEDWKSK